VVIKSIREISLQKTTSLEEEYTNTGTDSNGDPQPSTTLGEKFMMAPYVQLVVHVGCTRFAGVLVV
jgi:hypothetical protein